MRRAALAVLTAAAMIPAVTLTGTAQAVDRPLMAVVGDSFTAGWTGTTASQTDAWWNYTANNLGWTPGNIVADPGAGYVKPGMFGTIGQALRAHPIPASTSFVLLQAGLNDDAADPNSIPPAIADVLAVVHAQAPNAVPIVLGMFVPLGQGMSVNRLAVARRMGDFQAIGATRYSIAAMCTFETGPDGTHPTALGHHQIGDWVAWHLTNNLGGNGTPLHLDPTGTFYTT